MGSVTSFISSGSSSEERSHEEENLIEEKKEKREKISTTTIDKSKAHRGFLQHVALWLWIGWLFFYLIFFATFPIMYYYAPSLLAAILSLIFFSAFMPVDKRCQPKVRFICLYSKWGWTTLTEHSPWTMDSRKYT